ncbi:MAG: hypothetical protein A4S12_02210 [Proteobacteria bacterium SG_bin5]|nr:MAG: hypothetical protein A4S12_02210 [Proteobacteria bacterium SG_bin5]
MRARQIVGEVIGAGGSRESGQHPGGEIGDMDAAEHLARQVDPVRRPRRHPIERRTAGTVNAGQAVRARAPGEPGLVGGVAPRPAPGDGRAFIDPGAARVAINARRGEIAEPLARQCRAIAIEHRVAISGGRHAGEHRVGGAERGLDRAAIVEAQRVAAPVARRARYAPAPRARGGGDETRAIAQPENQQFHGSAPIVVGAPLA